MMQPPLCFERRSAGVYPLLFHAGPFYWPVAPEAVAALKEHRQDTPDAFRAALTATVATTPYLRHQLDSVLAGLEDRDTQIKALQQSLAAL